MERLFFISTERSDETMTPKKKVDPCKLCDLAHIADEKESTDVLGSYTGMGRQGEDPVQDQDDL